MKKKLAVLLLAAEMLLGASGSASAIDFKVKGWWWMAFDYASGGDFMGKSRTGPARPVPASRGRTSPWTNLKPGIASCSSWTPWSTRTSAVR